MFTFLNAATAGASLDELLFAWGSFSRCPGESDAQFRTRVKLLMSVSYRYDSGYLRLCLLLAKLRVDSARRDLPIGAI